MFEGTSAGDEFAGEVQKTADATTQGGIYSIEVVPDKTSKVPRYRITTKVRVMNPNAEVDKAEADKIAMGGDEDAFGGTVVANLYETYPVSRTLEELRWFRDQYWEKEPFSIVAPLPSPSKASSLKAVDQVLAMLFLMSSSTKTSTDPLFWALLTAADDDFQAQVQHIAKGEKISRAFWSTVVQYTTPQPKKEIKPAQISKAMMETTMVDRAFMTIDKMSMCVESMDSFEKRRKDRKEILDCWELAHEKLYMLRVALDNLKVATKNVSPALREMCDTNYWPWTKDKIFSDALQQMEESGGTLHNGHRLTHYMHRAANNAQQFAYAEGGVVSDEWAMGVSLCATLWRAYEHSAKHCDTYMKQTPLKSPSGGNTLVQLQNAAVAIVEKGNGFGEAERLERIDIEVTEIHDCLDTRGADFDNHFADIRKEIASRAFRHLKELRVAQELQWQSTQLLIDDFSNCLGDDPFLDLEDEPLPMFAKEPIRVPQPPASPGVVQPSSTSATYVDPAKDVEGDKPKFDARDSTLIARLFAAASAPISARSNKSQESARTFGRRLRQRFENENDQNANPFDINGECDAEEMSSMSPLATTAGSINDFEPTPVAPAATASSSSRLAITPSTSASPPVPTTSASSTSVLRPDELISRQEAEATENMLGGGLAKTQSVPQKEKKTKKKKSWKEVYENPDENEFGW